MGKKRNRGHRGNRAQKAHSQQRGTSADASCRQPAAAPTAFVPAAPSPSQSQVTQQASSNQATHPKRVDTLLSRAANFSQVGVLALAIFGYFYTVKPVFQNQVLQEQAAKLELEKKQSEKALASMAAERKDIEHQIEAARASLEKERAGNAALRTQTVAAHAEAAAAQLARTRLLETVRASEVLLAQSQLKLAIDKLDLSFVGNVMLRRMRERGEAGDTVHQQFPDVAGELLATLDRVRNQPDLKLIPASLWDAIHAGILSSREQLTCPSDAWNDLLTQYQTQKRVAEQELDAAVERDMDRVREAYAKQGKKAVFNEDYSRTAKAQLHMKYVYPVTAKFTEDRSNAESNCVAIGSKWLRSRFQN